MGKKQQTNTDSEYGESLPVTSHLRAGFYTRFFKHYTTLLTLNGGVIWGKFVTLILLECSR